MWDNLGAHSYLKDPTGQAVTTLEKNYGEFFRCLTVEVEKALDWTENDVKLNKGIFLDYDGREVPLEIKVLESKLFEKRIFNVSRFHLD
jgi:hypothetical protein